MTKTIIISEDQIIKAMQDWMCECEGDEFARITGEIFGGECYFIGGEYRFYPDEYKGYYGAFGEIEE